MFESKVYVYNFERHGGVRDTVRLLMAKLKCEGTLAKDSTVYIKLTLVPSAYLGSAHEVGIAFSMLYLYDRQEVLWRSNLQN